MSLKSNKSRKSIDEEAKKLSNFQWKVLKAAIRIPLGETRSYQWVAKKIGNPKAVRAVGQALRTNPYPIVIPCHRVIRSDGSLGGYAGEYGKKKRNLLELEQKFLNKHNLKYKLEGKLCK